MVVVVSRSVTTDIVLPVELGEVSAAHADSELLLYERRSPLRGVRHPLAQGLLAEEVVLDMC